MSKLLRIWIGALFGALSLVVGASLTGCEPTPKAPETKNVKDDCPIEGRVIGRYHLQPGIKVSAVCGDDSHTVFIDRNTDPAGYENCRVDDDYPSCKEG